MSNPTARSVHGKMEMSESGTTQQSYQSQSAWMAHWRPRNYGLANGTAPPTPLSVSNEVSEEESPGMKFHPLLNWREKLGKRKMVDSVKGSTAVGLERFRNEPSEGQPSLMLGCSRELEVALPPTKRRFDAAHVTSPVCRPDASSSRADNKLPASDPWYTTGQMETRPSGQNLDHFSKCNGRLSERNGLSLSMRSEGYFPGDTSQIVPYDFNSQRNGLQSSYHEQDDANRRGSSFWGHVKNMDSNGSLSVHDTSISKNEARGFAAEQVLKMPHRFSGPEYLTFQSGPLVPGMPSSSANDVQAMRVRTTIDSVTDFSAGCSKVLHTTQRFFITKKTTDLALPDEGQMFHQSSMSTKFNGKSLDESLGLAPDYWPHGNQGVKLQPLESSRESKGKEESENVKPCIPDSKNESSSETNTMDMDAFRQNHLLGLVSPPSSKDMNGGRPSPISQDTIIGSVSQEVRARTLKTQLPDINEEFHALPDVPGATVGKETSMSITQSLEVDCWPPLAGNPTNRKSSALTDLVALDSCSQWVKRLKPSAPDLVVCNLGEASHDKVKKTFSKMLGCGQESSEPKEIIKPQVKDPRGNDFASGLVRSTGPSFANSEGKVQAAMLSNPWIQRWCSDPVNTLSRKPDRVMAREKRGGAKLRTANDLPPKQFPSIAAMALMGKAMTGFRPCEFRRRGCLILWSNKGY